MALFALFPFKVAVYNEAAAFWFHRPIRKEVLVDDVLLRTYDVGDVRGERGAQRGRKLSDILHIWTSS